MGPSSAIPLRLYDIVHQHRMVFTYDMWVGDQHSTTSLTTITSSRVGGRQPSNPYTEKGVHFDGLTASGQERKAPHGLLDGRGAYLGPQRAPDARLRRWSIHARQLRRA